MLIDRVLSEAWRRDSRLHGEAHWYAVAATGLDLAADTGADHAVVLAFGLLHDTRRENEARDPQHGPRAAVFARELHADGVLDLYAGQLVLLCVALELHADGQVSDDPTIGTCWDADRLHLPRLGPGFRLDPALLSTAAARTARGAASGHPAPLGTRRLAQPRGSEKLVVRA